MEGLRVEPWYFGIHREDSQVEPYRGIRLQMPQNVQQGQGVLATGHPKQEPIPLTDHVVIPNCTPYLAQKGFGGLKGHGVHGG